MKINFKFISLLLIIFFISISLVSAVTDDNQTIAMNNIDDNDVIEANQSASSTKTFTDFQKEIDNAKEGDTINLKNDYTYDKGFDTEGIKINKNLKINGNGATFDGKSSSRIFNINANKVTITNINFINGKAGDGGAIYCSGSNLTINKCTFKNNKATDAVGGAAYILKGKCTITNSQFTKNTAASSGGALRINGDHITISNSVFTENQAKLKLGGAFHTMGNYTTVTKCNFTKNIAQYSGGAFRIEGFHLMVSNNNFYKNEATEFLGGAACVLGDYNTVKNNNFNDNYAGRDGGGLDIEGDIVDTDGLYNVVKNNVFTNNVVAQYGGGMTMNCQYGIIDNNTFIKNSAGILGGGFRVNGATRYTCNVTDNYFEKNTAGTSGGGIYLVGNDTIISKNTFLNNKATNMAGGGLTIHGHNSVVSNNKFESNSAGKSGGATYWEGNKAKFTNNVITDCHSGTSGGALYLKGASATVKNNKFTSNDADTIGGACQISGKNLALSNNKFTKNSADFSGGALYLDCKNAKITNNEFTSNKAGSTSSGGAIRVVGHYATIKGNTFKGNTAKTGPTICGSGTGKKLSGNTYVGSSESKQVAWGAYKEATSATLSKTTYAITAKTKSIVVTLKDSFMDGLAKKKLKLTINGKTYTKTTNKKGTVTLKLALNKIKTYKLAVKFAGDSMYKSLKKTLKFKVTKEATKLTAPTKTFKKSASSKKVTVTLKSASGKKLSKKKITLKVNGKKYTAKTNSKGQATVNVKLTTVKKFTYTVNFGGDSTYSAVTKKGKITIK